MSTWGQIRTNVFSKLMEIPGATFSDAEVTQFMLREYEHEQTLIGMEDDQFFAKTAKFDLKADDGTDQSRTYGFPEDFNKIVQIDQLIDARYIKLTHVPWINRESYAEGFRAHNFLRPALGNFYTYAGNCFQILPYSKTAIPDGGRMTYIPSFGVDADDLSPKTPKLYHEAIELGAVNRALSAMKQPPMEKEYYDEKIAAMIETISPRVKGRPRYVRMIDGLY